MITQPSIRTSSALDKCLLLMGLTLILIGCGGSGGGWNEASDEPTADIQRGIFSDIPVEGLEYRTSTLSGETDSAGTFEYRAGESVTFAVGDTVLGSASGADKVTPFELTGAVMLTDAQEINAALADGSSPYTAAINSSRLLHTLDEDSDPANGITIDAATRDSFVGVSLDFDRLPRQFANDPVTRDLLTSLDRILTKPEVALAHLYRSSKTELFVDAKRLSRMLEQTHESFGGSISFPRHSTKYQYNEDGNLVRTEYDTDGDLLPDRTTTHEYNTAGYRIHSEQDMDGDVVMNSTSRSTFDVSGNVVTVEYQSTGAYMNQRTTSYAYDAEGLRSTIEIDQGNDGVVNSWSSNSYDTEGRQIAFSSDSDGDGIVDNELSRTFNAEGQLVRSSYVGFSIFPDNSPPAVGVGPQDRFDPTSAFPEQFVGAGISSGGTPASIKNRVTDFFWNAAGHIIRRESDDDNDGEADRVTEYEYDESHRLVRWQHRGSAFIGFPTDDVSTEQVIDYTYNSLGHLIQREERNNIVGSSFETRQFTYDSDGRRLSMVIDSSGTYPSDGSWSFAYDELGNVYQASMDEDGDGAPEGGRATVWEATYRIDVNSNVKNWF